MESEKFPGGSFKGEAERASGSERIGETDELAMAVDVGTTTIAAVLVERGTGRVLRSASTINRQRAFGADVMSRIKAAVEGRAKEQRCMVWEDVYSLERKLLRVGDKEGICREAGDVCCKYDLINQENAGVYEGRHGISLVISANTTMQHIMRGLPCKTLGVAPYIPVDISFCREGNLVYLPGISTFVGADIVSGLYACGVHKSEKTVLFVDLGTNGEMAIGNSERILVASASAGPAFEGGNISCGCPGIEGAISELEIEGDKVSFQTIGDRPPVGLCGSGVTDLMYELLKAGIVDETGCLKSEYFDKGYEICDGIVFTQQDVRELQLAKAAVRAGIETLITEYGTDLDHIDRVYLAGGFGQGINLEKACGIGIIPGQLLEKTTAVEPDSIRILEHIVSISGEVVLADSVEFQELYIERMNF